MRTWPPWGRPWPCVLRSLFNGNPTAGGGSVSAMETRPATAARLARLGYADADRAAGLLAGVGLWSPGRSQPPSPEAAAVVATLGRSADPDRATLGLVRLVEAQDAAAPLLDRLLVDGALRDRLLAVLGASTALTDHL